MKDKLSLLLLFLILGFMLIPQQALAQAESYQLANRFFQQEKYEEALHIFKELYTNNPETNVFFDRYTETLIHLKMFDEAEIVARERLKSQNATSQVKIKLAEILHLKGEIDSAKAIWKDIIEDNPNSMQSWYAVASSMNDRREFELSIEILQNAQNNFNNPKLFLNELANTHLKAGNFDDAMAVYVQVILDSPDQMSFVQQRLLRMNDSNIFEIAAFEMEDAILDLEISHAAYQSLYQLLAWLLLETDEFERAFILARRYEDNTRHTIYSLFSLASQFESNKQFELAERAYKYYADLENTTLQYRAMHQLGEIYQGWANHLKQNNLAQRSQITSLNRKAYQTFQDIIHSSPQYDRITQVLANLIELSLDEFQEVKNADEWYQILKNSTPDTEKDPFLLYAEGRIALFNKNYTTARQALTRADKVTDRSNISEKSRYFLSLSEFYSGDFEFAEIQFRSLEKRNTSFYANEAVKWRMWIKNGMRADSTGESLNRIADGLSLLNTGVYNQSLDLFEPILASAFDPLSDDITVELTSNLSNDFRPLLWKLTNHQIMNNTSSPLRERLLWDRAKLTEELFLSQADGTLSEEKSFSFLNHTDDILFSESDVIEYYDDILIEFPEGFYAAQAREKLQQFESQNIIN